MKVAVSAIGDNLESKLSPVFGRCPYFIIANVENEEIKEWHAIKNPAEFQMGGAGIFAARTVANENVDAVISGSIGPKAFDVLSAVGIKMFLGVEGSVRENLEKLSRNELRELTAPMPGRAGRGWRHGGRWRGR